MKEKNIFLEFFKYVSLNVLGMIGLSCYILADTYFVAKGLGSNGLAALNLAIPIYSFIHGSGLMLGIGGATRYSMKKSVGNIKEGNEIFSHTLVFAALFAVIFILSGILFSNKITILLGADGAIFEMCKTYLRVLLLFSPAFLLNEVIICFVRNDGEPGLAMMAMLVGSFSNIILDYIFIFELKMGIFGAVFATGFAPVISLFIMSSHFLKRRNQFCFEKGKIQGKITRNIFAGGFPSLVAEISSGIVMMIFNGIMLKLSGNTGVAAYGVIANISLVVLAIYTGIAQGIQPLVSRYYGKGEQEKNHKILKYAAGLIVILSVLIYAGIFTEADGIAAVFNSEGNAVLQKIAVLGLKIYFTACIFAGWNIVLSVYFTSSECAILAHVISLLRGFFIIIPMAFLLSEVWGIRGLWMAFPVTELIVAGIGMIFLFQKIRKEEKRKN